MALSLSLSSLPRVSLVQHLLIGVVVRLVILAYAAYHDAHFLIKYTDIDYMVYSDGTEYLMEGHSPYYRATYRYTPILALLLSPNHFFGTHFGKILFTFCDLICGLLTYDIVSRLTSDNRVWATRSAALLIHNPLIVNVSTRGNADILVVMMILLAYSLSLRGMHTLCAFVLSLSIHLKLYPIIYVPIFYIALTPSQSLMKLKLTTTTNTDSSSSNNDRLYNFVYSIYLILLGPPRHTKIKFIFTFIASFIIIFIINYYFFGYEFWFHSLFYHFIRNDHRHNFSIYFYQIYLLLSQSSSPSSTLLTQSVLMTIIKYIQFIPQLTLLIFLSLHFHSEYMPLALVTTTLLFVAFNKVITAQYFIWYFALIPLIAPFMNISVKQIGLMAGVWLVTELHWLYWGYQLEFLGLPVYLNLWLASLLFFAAHIYIIATLIKCYQPHYNSTNASSISSSSSQSVLRGAAIASLSSHSHKSA